MKSQYFGDINDYLKYGLLRCFSDAGWRVSVCWMLTPDGGADGSKTRYLSDPRRWRKYDAALFDILASTVGTGACRNISIVEAGSVIPHASFFSEMVPDRRSARNAWFANAMTELSSADLIFFDPDNGLEVRSKPIGRKNSAKFLYWREVRTAWTRAQSLLIFQHFPRENRPAYTDRLVARLRREVPQARVAALRSSNVLFLLAYRREDEDRTSLALELIKSRWEGRIDLHRGR